MSKICNGLPTQPTACKDLQQYENAEHVKLIGNFLSDYKEKIKTLDNLNQDELYLACIHLISEYKDAIPIPNESVFQELFGNAHERLTDVYNVVCRDVRQVRQKPNAGVVIGELGKVNTLGQRRTQITFGGDRQEIVANIKLCLKHVLKTFSFGTLALSPIIIVMCGALTLGLSIVSFGGVAAGIGGTIGSMMIYTGYKCLNNPNAYKDIPQQPQQGGKARKGSYESMTVKELQQRCAKRKIKYSGMRKVELIAALRA